jgi:hypothetical protein
MAPFKSLNLLIQESYNVRFLADFAVTAKKHQLQCF